MFVEHKFYIGLSDINTEKELTNTCLLRYLEDVAGLHSEMAGYGITDMNTTRKSWILLSWKVEVKQRPLINDSLTVKTWSRCIDRFYAFRDFEVRNQYDEIVCIATSKWVFMDIDSGRLVKVSDEIAQKYKPELNSRVFEEHDLSKLKEPDGEIFKTKFKITRNLIDVNKHLHNIYYLDIAKEALPEEIGISNELNYFEIMYKKEIKLGENVNAIYTKSDDFHYVIIKSEDESITHAIIRLK
jgi:medium-chain acyl-[acyl-carrier-protein] hydrolase